MCFTSLPIQMRRLHYAIPSQIKTIANLGIVDRADRQIDHRTATPLLQRGKNNRAGDGFPHQNQLFRAA